MDGDGAPEDDPTEDELRGPSMQPELATFGQDLVEQDMDNLLTLFRDFNNGTHGHAGRFTITQLNALRVRVESAIGFIHAPCTV